MSGPAKFVTVSSLLSSSHCPRLGRTLINGSLYQKQIKLAISTILVFRNAPSCQDQDTDALYTQGMSRPHEMPKVTLGGFWLTGCHEVECSF